MNFPFNQPDKTRDCGYRCLYYALDLAQTYDSWIENFKYFTPLKSGIQFQDICDLLTYYGKDYKFTQLTDAGLYIIYSGIWLHPEGKKHGHYFVYHNGYVYCSTHKERYQMLVADVTRRLEAKTVDLAFRCLKVL